MAVKYPTPIKAALLLLTAALAGCSTVSTLPAAALDVAQSQSVEQADRKLKAVVRERAAAEAAYAAVEPVCYTKFFVNNCLEAASEKRRSVLAALRAVEVEAEHFKRKAQVEERDRALAEAEKEFQAEQAERAQQAEAAAKPPKAAAPAPKPSKRAAQQVKKREQKEAGEGASAAQRAANVRAYEEKRLESERRQNQIEEKKKRK